jgi:hypothetical protein
LEEREVNTIGRLRFYWCLAKGGHGLGFLGESAMSATLYVIGNSLPTLADEEHREAMDVYDQNVALKRENTMLIWALGGSVALNLGLFGLIAAFTIF